jgi:hypothetical protein
VPQQLIFRQLVRWPARSAMYGPLR